jgi:SulP family sulfate permease
LRRNVKNSAWSADAGAFRFTLAEFSGALADLGVMLPLVLALISLNGMDATAAFVGIGLAYILTAFMYRLPIPVQPLKSVSALALAMGLPPVLIVTGALWNAVAFLFMGLVGLDRWVQKAFPKAVVRGIQLGLAYLLSKSAWKLVRTLNPAWEGGIVLTNWALPWSVILVAGAALTLFILLRWKRDWAGVGVFMFGIGLASVHLRVPVPVLKISIPTLLPLVPDWSQLWMGFWLLALPQIPLSLGNSIYATADAARQYFQAGAERVTERRLMLTMGFNDLIAAVIGGVPVCHGCGGLTAHYRLGARSGGAPLMIGTIFLALGLVGGQATMDLFALIPFPILGVLLAYIAWQHALLARDLSGWHEVITSGLVLFLAVLTDNLAIGFIAGAIFYHLWNGIVKAAPRIRAGR